jgi:protein-L-isoaspartate(D-aspartate) O-methyltransferase
VDFAIQRTNMVESQVRPSDVTDRRIIRAMRDLPREVFVPERVRTLAYMDGSVPLSPAKPGAGKRSLLAARVFAKLVQAAEIDSSDTVLDIGVGSGYSSAVLAQLAGHVVALESDSGLAASARELLPSVGCSTVSVVEGDLAQGWASEGPYDAIIIEGAIEVVPDALFDQLKDGGRLVAISGRGAGRATVWQREGRSFGAADVFDASGDVLPGFEKPAAFAF